MQCLSSFDELQRSEQSQPGQFSTLSIMRCHHGFVEPLAFCVGQRPPLCQVPASIVVGRLPRRKATRVSTRASRSHLLCSRRPDTYRLIAARMAARPAAPAVTAPITFIIPLKALLIRVGCLIGAAVGMTGSSISSLPTARSLRCGHDQQAKQTPKSVCRSSWIVPWWMDMQHSGRGGHPHLPRRERAQPGRDCRVRGGSLAGVASSRPWSLVAPGVLPGAGQFGN
jgi:hypothetical protein